MLPIVTSPVPAAESPTLTAPKPGAMAATSTSDRSSDVNTPGGEPTVTARLVVRGLTVSVPPNGPVYWTDPLPPSNATWSDVMVALPTVSARPLATWTRPVLVTSIA